MPDHAEGPHSRPSDPPGVQPTSPYTAACRRCGMRLCLSDEEMVASLNQPPICWPCDHAEALPG